jgi:hypothetical protein
MMFGRLTILRTKQHNNRLAAKVGAHYGRLCQGADAYRAHKSPCSCPFVLDTDEWHDWIAGWLSLYDRHNWSI